MSDLRADEAVAAPRRRRGRVIALVVVVVLVLLVVGGGAAGEALARSVGTQTAQRELASALDVSDPRDVDVDLGSGSVLLQALGGRLDHVTASTDRLSFDDVTASLRLDAEGVPLSRTDTVRRVAATVAIDEQQAEKLGRRVSTLPIDSVTFGAAGLTVTGSTRILSLTVPVSLVFVPSVSGGRLLLTPTTAVVSGQTIQIADLRSGPFAGLAKAIPENIGVCVNEKLPAGVGLTSVKIVGSDLRLSAQGDDVALSGGGKGTCT